MALFATATEALPRFLPEALGPIRNGLVPAHPAEYGPGGYPQHRGQTRSEEHTSELQSRLHLVCRLLLEKKKKLTKTDHPPTPTPNTPSHPIRCPHHSS